MICGRKFKWVNIKFFGWLTDFGSLFHYSLTALKCGFFIQCAIDYWSVSVSAEILVSVCILVSVSLHLSVSAEISVQNQTKNRNCLFNIITVWNSHCLIFLYLTAKKSLKKIFIQNYFFQIKPFLIMSRSLNLSSKLKLTTSLWMLWKFCLNNWKNFLTLQIKSFTKVNFGFDPIYLKIFFFFHFIDHKNDFLLKNEKVFFCSDSPCDIIRNTCKWKLL